MTSPTDLSDGLSARLSAMTGAVPVLETPRLVLRCPSPEDFPAWREHMADEETMRFLGGVNPPHMAWRNMMTVVGAWPMVGFSMFSVIEKATGRWVGRLGPWHPEGWPGNEVGWAIVRDCWGKGYATEGAQAAVDFAFGVLGWDEVIHSIESANAPSIAVAHRLGSKLSRKAMLPAPIDKEIDIYSQTRDAWLAAKSRA